MPGQLTHIAANVAKIRRRIAEAARRSGRSADLVKLIAVTKYAGPDEIRAWSPQDAPNWAKAVRNSFGNMPRLLAICRSVGT